MNGPVFHGAITVAPDVISLAGAMPVPGLGALPVNAFLIEGVEPVLIDAGLPALAVQALDALASRIDLAQLRWIWLTHCDADHIGALDALLQLAPSAKIVTNYLGMGKLSMRLSVPPERVHLINPGQELDVGDRRLRALSLPSYDAPETMGAFDPVSGALFCSDCFGALLSVEEAMRAVADARSVGSGRLTEGLATWAMVDAPWLSVVDPGCFRASLRKLVELDPRLVLGAHLPPAHKMIHWLVTTLDAARGASPFVGPSQMDLEAMLGAA